MQSDAQIPTGNEPASGAPVRLERVVSCPFCGGKDPVTLKQSADNGVRYAIMCQYAECCGRTGCWHSEEQAISKWNRRAANDKLSHMARQKGNDGR